MNKELKPCPFCGGSASIKTDLSGMKWLSKTARNNAVGISCKKCGAMFAFRWHKNCISVEEAVDLCNKYWNRRHDND